MIRNQSFSIDSDILGGIPAFAGTRVPVSALVDYLTSGQTIDQFLDDFPTVKREQAISALHVMENGLHAHPH